MAFIKIKSTIGEEIILNTDSICEIYKGCDDLYHVVLSCESDFFPDSYDSEEAQKIFQAIGVSLD